MSASSSRLSPVRVSVTASGCRYLSYFTNIPLRLYSHSLRKVPARETQDGKWGGYPVRYDFTWLRKLRGSAQDLLVKVSRGKTLYNMLWLPVSPPTVGGLVGVLSYAKYSSRLSPPVANTRIGQRAAATMLEGPWADPTRKVDDLVHRLPAAFLKQQITQTIS